MKKDQRKALQNLETFLTRNNELSKDDLKAELSANGVDVEAFRQRIQTTVRKGWQFQQREIAEREEQQARGNRREQFGDIRAMTKDDLTNIFEQIRAGVFGAEYKEAALARCRNQSDAFSEDELRSWLADIAAMKEKK
jgi:hypothetical protein